MRFCARIEGIHTVNAGRRRQPPTGCQPIRTQGVAIWLRCLEHSVWKLLLLIEVCIIISRWETSDTQTLCIFSVLFPQAEKLRYPGTHKALWAEGCKRKKHRTLSRCLPLRSRCIKISGVYKRDVVQRNRNHPGLSRWTQSPIHVKTVSRILRMWREDIGPYPSDRVRTSCWQPRFVQSRRRGLAPILIFRTTLLI